MTDEDYHRMTNTDLKGRRVRLLRSWGHTPIGTIARITRKSGGLGLRCGLSFIGYVPPAYVELVPEEGENDAR